jgi:hypothetical protein
MSPPGPDLWTIHELGENVARALAHHYLGARDARTRDVPDLRTIRYYTTLGLLDRPAEMRGRTALYGRRHLLQLVAIKQLQSRGMSLTQIQQRLLGATDAALAEFAGRGVTTDPGRPTSHRGSIAARDDRLFWKERPAPVSVPSSFHNESGVSRPTADVKPPAAAAYEEARPLQAVGLEGDVVVLLPAPRVIDPAEIAAIRRAAAPLIQHLRKLRLIQPAPKGEDDDQIAAGDR